MGEGVEIRVGFPPDDEEISRLHQLAFGAQDHRPDPWTERLRRHSVTWVGAFLDDRLVGFVNVCWDGGVHGFLLDTMVHPDHRRRGLGRAVVSAATQEAARAGCQWLHVDYEPHLGEFYREACGFRPTDAGLVALVP